MNQKAILLILAGFLFILPAEMVSQNLSVDVTADPPSICEGNNSTLIAIPKYTNQSNKRTLSRQQNENERPVITITFSSAVTQDDFTIEKADLKYDKSFAFSIQVDDGLTDIIEKAVPLLEGGNYQGEELPGLYYTDGCGNDVSFKMATAHYSWNAYNQNDMHNPANGYNDLGDFSTMTWDEIIELYQLGWGIYNHGFLDNGTTGSGLDYDVNRNHSYTRRNTHPEIEGGINMNVFVIPGSTTGLGPVAINNGYNQVISVNYSSGDPYYNVNEVSYYNTEISRHFGLAELYSTVNQLATVASNGQTVMSTTGLHDFGFQEFRDEVEAIEQDYGKSGTDQLWFTTSEEVIQYLHIRDNIQVASQIDGNTVTVTLEGNLPSDLRFYAQSLLIESETEITDIQIENGFNKTYNLDYNGQALINLNWDERVITPPEDLAEEFVSIAEETGQTSDALIGVDYTEMIQDTTVRNYYRSRLCAISDVALPEGYCSNIESYNYEWTLNGEVISSDPAIEVSPSNTSTYEVIVDDGSETASESVTVEVKPNPFVEAQPNDSLCANQSYQLSLLESGNYSQILWESAGDGSFSDASVEEPEYLPADSDHQKGEVLLYVTAISEGCENARDSVLLSFIDVPEINLPTEATICENSSYELNLDLAGGSTVSWSTLGDGEFSSSTGASSIYSPGKNDVANGEATIVSTVETGSPCNYRVYDSLHLIIRPIPVAQAGNDTSVCYSTGSITLTGKASYNSSAQWSTNNGSGSFTDNGLSSTYSITEQDRENGQIKFYFEAQPVSPCGEPVIDSMNMDIIPSPVASAGNDTVACAYTSFYIEGQGSNYESVYWTTSGDGIFANSNNISTYYNFGEDDKTQEEITLTLHTIAKGYCDEEASDDIVLTLPDQPVIYAGDDDAICKETESYELSGEVSGTDEFTWITQGDGTFSDTTALNPVYYPGENEREAGAAYPGMKTTGNEACNNTIRDFMLLKIEEYPTIDAGTNQAVCTGTPVQLKATGSNYDKLMWSTQGDGTFNNKQKLNATYYPSQNDQVDLYISASKTNSCDSTVTDTLTIFFVDSPTVQITKSSKTFCETFSGTISCNGTASNHNSVEWSTSGTGDFESPNLLNTNYSPSPTDLGSEQINLILTAKSTGLCQKEVSDTLPMNFQPLPSVDAGGNVSVCENENVSLAGQVSNSSNVNWSTSGTGIFENTLNLNTTYYPSDEDTQGGSVILLLTADATTPCEGNMADNKIVYFDMEPTASIDQNQDTIYAGEEYDFSVSTSHSSNIQWNASGFGELSSTDQTVTTYQSVPNDTIDQPVIIRVSAYPTGNCQTVSTDEKSLYVLPVPEIYAGQDIETCITTNGIELSGSAELNSPVTWSSSSDDGTFENPKNPETTYYPGGNTNSNLRDTLTLSADENPDFLNDKLIVTFHDPPSCELKDDTTICGNDTLFLAPEVSNFSSVEWNTSGNGDFTHPESTQTAYLPGNGDIEEGNVTLTLNAFSEICSDDPSSQNIKVSIHPSPAANAGIDSTFCSSVDTISLADINASHYNSLRWTTSGTGDFSDPNSLQPEYYPSEEDKNSEEVSLTLNVTNEGTCSYGDKDIKTLHFSKIPEIGISEQYYSCDGNTVELKAQANDFDAINWYSQGEGIFIDQTGVVALYQPGGEDISNGYVNISAVADGKGVCSAVSDTAFTTIEIISKPTVEAGNDLSTCNNSIMLNGESSSSNVTWKTSGTGYFENENLLNTRYYPGEDDFNNGEVTLTLSAKSAAPCQLEVTDELVLSLSSTPESPQQPAGDETICAGSTSETQFTTNEVEKAEHYVWYLTPSRRGEFAQDTTDNPSNTLIWGDYTGSFAINVKAINQCGASPFSEGFQGYYASKPNVEIQASPDSIVCMNQTITLDATTPNDSSYLWTPGNLNTPTITISSSDIDGNEQTFNVLFTDLNGCSNSDNIKVIFTTCTSSPSLANQKPLVSPNPANEYLKISYNTDSHIKIVNINGRVVKSLYHKFSSNPEKKIRLDNLPTGFYYISLENKQTSHIQKFVHIQ